MQEGYTPAEAPSAEFALTRFFDSPVEALWAAYTDADQLQQWWETPGGNIQVAKLQLQSGGVFLFNMPMAEGEPMWAKWVYREVHHQQKLEYLISFCDEQGQLQRQPGLPTWPLELLCSTSLTPKDHGTLLTSVVAPWNATEQEHDIFDSSRSDMTQGFNHTWDQLAAYLRRTNS